MAIILLYADNIKARIKGYIALSQVIAQWLALSYILFRVPSIRENQGKSGRNLFFWKVRESQGICRI